MADPMVAPLAVVVAVDVVVVAPGEALLGPGLQVAVAVVVASLVVVVSLLAGASLVEEAAWEAQRKTAAPVQQRLLALAGTWPAWEALPQASALQAGLAVAAVLEAAATAADPATAAAPAALPRWQQAVPLPIE